jgi:hypothetical protein
MEGSMRGPRAARAAGVRDGKSAQLRAKAYDDRTGVATESSRRRRGLALAARPRPPRKNHNLGIGRNAPTFQQAAAFCEQVRSVSSDLWALYGLHWGYGAEYTPGRVHPGIHILVVRQSPGLVGTSRSRHGPG